MHRARVDEFPACDGMALHQTTAFLRKKLPQPQKLEASATDVRPAHRNTPSARRKSVLRKRVQLLLPDVLLGCDSGTDASHRQATRWKHDSQLGIPRLSWPGARAGWFPIPERQCRGAE